MFYHFAQSKNPAGGGWDVGSGVVGLRASNRREVPQHGGSFYLLVEAKDGYKAVFAWAELDSTFLDKALYVVTRRDGKPISEKEGPFLLVIPGEKRAARWVRQLTALAIKQAN